ncbi:hypothetical protein Patl1_27546 [Pistacia atlantica]|uniref:Uncharacterized protein n=1 Tax=Pistacia atlantica TaxID=434234 RepID=A0ACC1BDV6_9ROSI|nr:hypothetical protein Patl1_27546 [Pistacia atlantica]
MPLSHAAFLFLDHQRSPMGSPNAKAKPQSPTAADDDSQTPQPPPPRQPVSLVQPSERKKNKSTKVFRIFRSVFRSFPIVAPTMCKISVTPGSLSEGQRSSSTNGKKVTGTLFGYRKGRVSFSIQENPKCLPSLVLELAMQTNVLQKGNGHSPVSMGGGVLPGNCEVEGSDGELAYMRAHFERVVGSKDSETYYMLSPEGNNGTELSIFFVRI